jgi:hypothetical protein
VAEFRSKIASGEGKRSRHEENAKAVMADVGKLRSSLTMKNFLPQFILFGVMISIYWWVSSVYDNQVVALLPFEPISFFRGILHRGAPGENYYHCSVAGIFALASMGLRTVFAKVFAQNMPGASSSGGGMFDMSTFQQQMDDARNAARLKQTRRG